jgi:hypothetical protein
MKKLAIAASLGLLLAGCSSMPSWSGLNPLNLFTASAPAPAAATAPAAPAAADGALNAQAARITDERILADSQTLEGVQLRLRKLSEAGIAQNNYSLAKAQCWLDTARSQYQENDRTGYIEESLAESLKIVRALEADKAARAGLDTPLVARSSKLREDLWQQLAALKTPEARLLCNGRSVACAEVRLVRAGHAEEQTGWRSATPHVQMAEDGLRRATTEAAACAK